MNIRDLSNAIKATRLFVSKDETRPHLCRVAISASRVRACDGHRVIHVWDESIGDFDLGPVSLIGARDAKAIVAFCENTMKLAGDEAEPAVNWTFTDAGFAIEEKAIPMLEGTTVDGDFPPTDKVLQGQFDSHIGGVEQRINPAYAVAAFRAMAAIGAINAGVALGKARDTGTFVHGSSETLRAVCFVMGMRVADDSEGLPRVMLDRAARRESAGVFDNCPASTGEVAA